MNLIKAYIRYILYLLKIRTTIPAVLINRKRIQDNGDQLVDLRQNKDLFFGDSLSASAVLIRSGVAEKLEQASKLLPENVHFKVLSAYRSMAEQQNLYNTYYQQMKHDHPTASETDWERMTKAICANPKNGGGGHQTGGAVDITLCDQDGNDLDMGSGYLEMCSKTPTRATNISFSACQNRKILCQALQAVDMQNYPNEWWHFCYGDKMWAAYRHKKYAIYGPIYIDE